MNWIIVYMVVFLLTTGGCGVRSMPPVKYMPILGSEPHISTSVILSQGLKDSDPAIRSKSIELLALLAKSADPKVAEESALVLGAALRDPDPSIRILAVEKLGELHPNYGNRFLFRALRDSNPFVRERVIQVLQTREHGESQPQTNVATPDH